MRETDALLPVVPIPQPWLQDDFSFLLAADTFARQLLMREHVAVLPCDSFGPSAAGRLRISLTAPEPRLEEAGRRIVRFARGLASLGER